MYDETANVFREPGYCDAYMYMTEESLEWCLKHQVIPAKRKLLVSLRDDVFRHEDWHYLAAGTVYVRASRRAEWEFDGYGGINYIFDCTKSPSPPPNMQVVMHNDGLFTWDQTSIQLFSPKPPSCNKWPRGYDYMKMLVNKQPLNATALEYLLSDPGIIPKEWGGKQILFLGTTYASVDDDLHGSLLFCNNGRWAAAIVPPKHELAPDAVYAAVRTV